LIVIAKRSVENLFFKKEAEFMRDMDELFDIFCSDDQQRRQLEKNNTYFE